MVAGGVSMDTIHTAESGNFMLRQMTPNSIDLIVTSPPYDNLRDYNGYEFDARAIGDGMHHVLKPGGVAVWVVGEKIKGGRTLTCFRQGLMFTDEIGFTMHDLMIYQKANTPFMRSNAYTNAHEMMFVMVKGTKGPKTFNPLLCETKRNGRETAVYSKGADGDNSKRRPVELRKQKVRTNIWRYAVGLGGTTTDRYAFEHPAMFPERLAEDMIRSWTNAGDVVLDPMCGAGTTLKMAVLNSRRYVGVDISSDYTRIARRRVREAKARLNKELRHAA